ncbi:MAG: hypothetical protein ACI4AK_09715 [Lepagella sp.]
MEDKKISQAESLAIIADMIDRTKSHHHLCNGSILLLWGYLSVAVAMIVALLLWLTGHPAVNWLWFLIWIVGGTITPVMERKYRARVGTLSYFDKVCSGIWSIVGYSAIALTFACLGFLLFGGKDCWGAMFFFAFGFVGFAETVQGIILRVKPLIVGGAIGLLAGVVTLCCLAGGVVLSFCWAIPLFILAFTCMMIIPGHILNAKAKDK